MSNKQSQENPNITLEMGNKQSQHQEMEDHSFLGDALLSLGAYEMAIECHEKSLNIALESGNKIGEGNAYYNLGRAYTQLRKNQKAIEYYQKGLNIAKETGNKTLEGEIYRHIGITYQLWNKYQEAIEHYEKGLNIAKEEANKKEEASTYCGLGSIYNSSGKYNEAIEYNEKSLKLALEIGDKSLEGTIYLGQGEVYLSLSNYQEALKCYEKSLNISSEMDKKDNVAKAYKGIGNVYSLTGKYQKAIECYERSLNINLEIRYKRGEGRNYTSLGSVYFHLGKYQEAMEYCKKGLNIAIEQDDKMQEGTAYQVLGNIHLSLGKHLEAIDYIEKSLKLALKVGDKDGEIVSYSNLGNVYLTIGKHKEAIINYEKGLNIALEIGDKRNELGGYKDLGNVYFSLGIYQVAIEYHEKSLNIALESGNKIGEGNAYYDLGRSYSDLCKNQKAIEYYKKGLNIAKETGNKTLEGEIYWHIGITYQLWNKYQEAIEYYEKGLNIAKEKGNKKEEARISCGLGNIYNFLDKYDEAIEYNEKSLKLALEIGDKSLEGTIYLSQGNVCKLTGKYKEAIEYYEKSLNIHLEIRDKKGEGKNYTNLGSIYVMLGKFQDAMEYCEKGLNIAIEIDDKDQEGSTYETLGNIYLLLGKYREAIEYKEKSLKIALEVGNKNVVIVSYLNLGNVYLKLGKHREAIENCTKGLNIALEIGSKHNELAGYKILGNVYFSLGVYQVAIEYHEKSLNIATETVDKDGEASSYITLGNACYSLSRYQEALEYGEKSLRIAKEIGNKVKEARANLLFGKSCWSLNTTVNNTDNNESFKNNQDLSIEHLKECVRCWDDVYEHSHKQDDSNISIVDTFIQAYNFLTTVLIETSQTEEALLVCDRGRARALGDILISKYGIDKEHTLTSTTLEYPDVTKMLSKNNFSILFFAVEDKILNTWVIASQTPLFFATSKNKENMTLHKVINESFDKMKVREIVRCEDRSLESCSENVKLTQDGDKDVKFVASSVERDITPAPAEETQRSSERDRDPLKKLFNILIAPVLQELKQEEIVIIPDGPLYTVPFAALRDPNTGQLLSETKRIRLAPSLATLKTLQECPSDYHCKMGALIVGDPYVGEVMFKGKKILPNRLPSAEYEAEKVGAILKVKPLTGLQATKEKVKHKLQEGVSIIHIAAHGDSKHGHIALAPTPRVDGTSIPEEEDYMLTMQEVQEIGVKAQLVVLSCCHSGRGEIRSEGVVGMSRAFLAAGARAVVASLWAVDDEATLSFMESFYKYLKMGDSASKSLQQAMKDLREEGYDEPRHWAPFFLIGDDVSLYKREPIDREKGLESVLTIEKIACDFNHPALVEMNSPNTGCLSVLIRRDLSTLLSESDDNASKIFEHLKTRHAAVLQTSSSEISLERRRFVRENFNKICNEKKHTKITTSEKQEVITYETIADIQNTFEELGIDISNVQTTNIVELGLKAKEVSEADAVTAYLKRAARKILKSNSQRIHSIIPYHYRRQIAVVIYTYDPTTELVKQNWSDNFLGFTVFIVNLKYSYEVEPPAFPKCYPAIPLEKQESLSKIKDKVTQEFAKKHSNLSSISVDYRIRGNKLDKNEYCLQIGVLTKGIAPLGEEMFCRKIEGIPVDVVECSATLCAPLSEIKFWPVNLGAGISIEGDNNSTGSLGAVVKHKHNESGELFLLSNAHVLYREEVLSSHIVQPSQQDYDKMKNDTEKGIRILQEECEGLNQRIIRETELDNRARVQNLEAKLRLRTEGLQDLERKLETVINTQQPRVIGTFSSHVRQGNYSSLLYPREMVGIDAAIASITRDEFDAENINKMYTWPDDLKDEMGEPIAEIALNGDFMNKDEGRRALASRSDVFKCGRTTGVTKGKLWCKMNVRMGGQGDFLPFVQQNQPDRPLPNQNEDDIWYNVLHIKSVTEGNRGERSFCAGGDSGAVVFDEKGTCVGLLFGRIDTSLCHLGGGLATPIHAVFDALNITLASSNDLQTMNR